MRAAWRLRLYQSHSCSNSAKAQADNSMSSSPAKLTTRTYSRETGEALEHLAKDGIARNRQILDEARMPVLP